MVPHLWSWIPQYIESVGSNSTVVFESLRTLFHTVYEHVSGSALFSSASVCHTPAASQFQTGINLVPLPNRACDVEGTAKRGRIINGKSLNDQELDPYAKQIHSQSELLIHLSFQLMFSTPVCVLEAMFMTLALRRMQIEAAAKCTCVFYAAVPSRSQCLETLYAWLWTVKCEIKPMQVG